MASNKFIELKNKVKSCTGDRYDAVYEECKIFIDSLILDGMNSYNSFYQAYCAYAQAMGINYVKGTSNSMYVSIVDGKISFNIDAFGTIVNSNSENDIMFCVAHEVKHLLYKHLIKYGDMFSDDVLQLFMNMATDVEINESLKVELAKGEIFETKADTPVNVLYLSTVGKILDLKNEYLNRMFRKYYCTGEVKSVSDFLYEKFDMRCKEWLGYSINEILYRVKLAKTTFNDEIFKVVDGDKNNVFNISNPGKARKFCEEIAKYLTRNITAFIMVADNGKIDLGEGEYTVSGTTSVFDIEDIMESVEKFKDTYIDNIGEKGRSVSGSGSIDDIYVYDCETVVPWQTILRNRISSLATIKVPTKKRINRRQPRRMELSGRKNIRKISVVVAIDESGSISNLEYNYFISELCEIVNQVDCDIHFYEFTSGIESYKYFDSIRAKKELKIGNKSFTNRYTGGTCFQPIFNAIQDNKKIRKSDSILITFTDGYGDSTLDFKGMTNRLWVVVGKETYLSVENELKSNIFGVIPRKRKEVGR